MTPKEQFNEQTRDWFVADTVRFLVAAMIEQLPPETQEKVYASALASMAAEVNALLAPAAEPTIPRGEEAA